MLINMRIFKTFREKQTSLPFQINSDSFTQYTPSSLKFSGFLKEVNIVVYKGFYHVVPDLRAACIC